MCVNIGNLKIEGKTALAPMAGVTDRACREIFKKFGVSYVVSEMVSAKGILYGNPKTLELLKISDDERPCGIQIFGNEPRTMANAAKFIEENFRPDVIDINMGCPAPKIVSNGSGSALMKNPDLCGSIVYDVKSSVRVPVTVKIRKGWDEENINAVEISKICEKNGADAIVVHGRTRTQMYKPKSDLGIIKSVKEEVNIPVIGNGDIFSGIDAGKMTEFTNCDMVMVGRGSLGNPWIFRDINSYINGQGTQYKPSLEERVSLMREHVLLICKYKGEKQGVLESRKVLSWYMKGMSNASKFRKMVFGIKNILEMEEILSLILKG